MKNIRSIITILFLFLSARVITEYLQPRYTFLVTIALFAGACLSARYLVRLDPSERPARMVAGMMIFSVLFALSLVMGYHLQIKKAYDGLYSDNLILPYSWKDAASFFLMIPGIALPACALCAKILRIKKADALSGGWVPASRFRLKAFFLILAGYIPYLLLYWPGLVMSDTMTSLHEALGYTGLTSHHPVFYTLWIRLCLTIGRITGGGNTAGCVIYCIVQMAFMAWTFAFMTDRIVRRLRLPAFAGYPLAAVFGFTPYIAGYSVAMWKDPIFSCALILLSIRLFDFIHAPSGRQLPRLLLLSVLVTASRSNGFYVMLFVLFALVVAAICIRITEKIKITEKKEGPAPLRAKSLYPLICSLLVLLVCARIIHGPVYRSLDIQEKKEEAVGIFLNQMARAVVLGSLSEEDSDYMDRLLPLDVYPEAYTPCTTDHLKWNTQFDRSVLEDGFFRHWLSMFRDNPKIFFDAWQLETTGFWAVNVKAVNTFARNMQGGVPRNLNENLWPELENVDIKPANLLHSDFLREVFSLNEWSIPVSWITWLILYLILCFAIHCGGSSGSPVSSDPSTSSGSPVKRYFAASLLSLAPSAGLIATLLLASPIWYWARYGAAVQFLLPFYLALVLPARKTK